GGVAFMGPDGSGALTYAHAQAFTHRVAAALVRDGFPPGTPVGVLSPNAPAVLPCVLGALRAGCAWVALNARAAPAELAALLDLVGARVLLWSAALAPVADEIRARVPSLERTIVVDDHVPGADHLDGWLAP